MLELSERQGYYVYILECADHSYYTGWTTNPKRRYEAHKCGKGAKYTRLHPPIDCVYLEACPDRIAAMKREFAIKQFTHKQKEALIQAWQKEQGYESIR